MSEQPAKPRKFFISLRLRLLIFFTVIFVVVFAGVFYWFYDFSTQKALSLLGADIVSTLNGTVGGIDPAEFTALYNEAKPNADNFTDDPRYWKQIAWLDQVHQIEPRAWPFTYVEGTKDREVIFVTDLQVKYNLERTAHFQESYTPSMNVMRDGLDHPLLYLTIYSDKWGNWISGYMPITDSSGKSVGAVGIDFTADYVLQVQQAIKDSVLPVFVITFALVFGLVFLISRAVTRPVVALTRAATLIGEGKYEQDLSHLRKGLFADEITKLAEVFEIMVSKVYQREQTLIRKVEELKIEIDEVKRQKQVSEIAETDFFRDLQSKASMMRNRRQGDESQASDKAS
ncbi:MAG: HAMP domain-containing protein [Anaerolineae bacterium]|nr:HAMP domain-containing protein [Anaerolineae bacterium]